MTLSELEHTLCDSISARADELIHDLTEDVAIPTGCGYRPGLDAFRELMCQRLRALGASVELLEGAGRPSWVEGPGGCGEGQPRADSVAPPIVCARRLTQSDGPCVLLVGHLDTVHDPQSAFRQMTIGPDGQNATGPGVVDMKGGLIILLTALRALEDVGIALPWTLLLNSDEETGSFQSFDILQDEARKHDVGLVMEPALADGSLAIERMGSGQFCIEVFGQSSHVGRAFAQGVSAVNRLAEILLLLRDLARPDDGIIVNVGPLQGGSVTNAVPDYAACWGNVRYKDANRGERLAEAIDALETSEDAMPRVAVHRKWNRPAKPCTPPVQALAESLRVVAGDLGQAMPFSATGGVCDGNILQAAGLPTLDTLGARGGNLHRPDEFIDLTSLVERSQLLAVFLTRLANGQISISS